MKSENIIHGIKLPRLAFRLVLAVAIIALVFAMARPVFAVSPIPPSLGSAANFAVLGASTVTNTGATVITGDLGVSPGTAITGFPPGTVIGTVHTGAGVAAQAHTDLATAYAGLVAMPCVAGSANDLTGKNLGGMTLSPGVYCFSSSAQLTGTLHLSGAANDVYVFKIGSTLTTASNSFVIVDSNPCGGNVYWQITSSATLGTGTTFAGNILAQISITINTSATISGRALAITGAVTMDTNKVSACGAGIPNGGPCGGDTETGDTDHHRDDDKGKHVGNDSVKDQAQSVMTALGKQNPQHQATHSTSTGHDTGDSHGHRSGDHGHDDSEGCSDNQRDNDNDDNVQGTDGDRDHD